MNFGVGHATGGIDGVAHQWRDRADFDHIFGWAGDLLGVDGVTGNECLPTSTEAKDPTWVPVSKNAP